MSYIFVRDFMDTVYQNKVLKVYLIVLIFIGVYSKYVLQDTSYQSLLYSLGYKIDLHSNVIFYIFFPLNLIFYIYLAARLYIKDFDGSGYNIFSRLSIIKWSIIKLVHVAFVTLLIKLFQHILLFFLYDKTTSVQLFMTAFLLTFSMQIIALILYAITSKWRSIILVFFSIGTLILIAFFPSVFTPLFYKNILLLFLSCLCFIAIYVVYFTKNLYVIFERSK